MVNVLFSYLIAKGFSNITTHNDGFGIDITAEKDGKKIGFVCNTTVNPVDIDLVQSVYSGKSFYDCNAVILATIFPLTVNAIQLAAKLKIIVWNAQQLVSRGILASEPTTPPKKSKRKTKKHIVLGIVATVIVACMVFGAFFFFPSSETVTKKVTLTMDTGNYVEALSLLNRNKRVANYSELYDLIKFESIVLECILNLKPLMKNPSSLQITRVDIYRNEREYPSIIIYSSGQNGFGGYSTSISTFSCTDLTHINSISSLDPDDLDSKDDSYLLDLATIVLITDLLDDNKKYNVDIDLNRINNCIQNSKPIIDNSVYKQTVSTTESLSVV